MDKLQLEEYLPVKRSKGVVSPVGVAQIVKICGEAGMPNYGLDGFDWSWKNASGSIVKRIGKTLYEKQHIKFTDEQFSKMGTIAAKYSNDDAEKYLVQITNNVAWAPGDFADGGSCMFSHDRKYAFDQVLKSGGHMVRLFIDIKPKTIAEKDHPLHYLWKPHFANTYEYTPVGRAFIWDLKDTNYFLFNSKQVTGVKGYVIMNGYMANRDTDYLAQMVHNVLNGKSILKAVTKVPGGTFYSNAGSRIVAVEHPDDLNITGEYYVEVNNAKPNPNVDHRQKVCPDCNSLFPMGENMHAKCAGKCTCCGHAYGKNTFAKNPICPACGAYWGWCFSCQRILYSSFSPVNIYSSKTAVSVYSSPVMDICRDCIREQFPYSFRKIACKCDDCGGTIFYSISEEMSCPRCGKPKVGNSVAHWDKLPPKYPKAKVCQAAANAGIENADVVIQFKEVVKLYNKLKLGKKTRKT